MSDFRALLGFAAPHRMALAFCALLMLVESAAALLVPWAGGLLTDALLRPGDDGNRGIGVVLSGMLALFVLQALLKFGNTYLLGNTADRMVSDLKTSLYDHLQSLPLAYYHERRLGDTLALLTSDVYVLSGYISGTALALVPLLFTAGGAVILMFRIRPSLALLAVVLIPLFYLLMKIVGRRMRPLAAQVQEEYATAIAIAQENLGLLPAIKTFTREQRESTRYREQIDRIFRLNVRQRRIYAALEPLAQLIAAIGIVLVLALASGDLTAGRRAPAPQVGFLV